jgi:hypothetical protein
VYKPKFRSADGMMGPGSADIMSRRSNKFEMQVRRRRDADFSTRTAVPAELTELPIPVSGNHSSLWLSVNKAINNASSNSA